MNKHTICEFDENKATHKVAAGLGGHLYICDACFAQFQKDISFEGTLADQVAIMSNDDQVIEDCGHVEGVTEPVIEEMVRLFGSVFIPSPDDNPTLFEINTSIFEIMSHGYALALKNNNLPYRNL